MFSATFIPRRRSRDRPPPRPSGGPARPGGALHQRLPLLSGVVEQDVREDEAEGADGDTRSAPSTVTFRCPAHSDDEAAQHHHAEQLGADESGHVPPGRVPGDVEPMPEPLRGVRARQPATRLTSRSDMGARTRSAKGRSIPDSPGARSVPSERTMVRERARRAAQRPPRSRHSTRTTATNTRTPPRRASGPGHLTPAPSRGGT